MNRALRGAAKDMEILNSLKGNIKIETPSRLPRNVYLDLLYKYPNRIVWDVNTFCNYNCPYCYREKEIRKHEHPAVGRRSPQEIKNCFDHTKREWLILISGGEPFFYPNFIELMGELTKGHYVQISTNLSSPSVYEFAERISPERVMVVCASLHIVQHEEIKNAYDEFVDKCLHLQKKGFALVVAYVTYPNLFTRMRKDFEKLRAAGIDEMRVLTFRGKYEGKVYPGAYTKEQLALINEFAIEGCELDIAKNETRWRGCNCDAGCTYFRMDCNGDLYRCCTIATSYGNLFDGTYRFADACQPCTVEECHDAYLGFAAVHRKK
jgi:MoaA/NifB/PqqE/SkfB family radical SAM enzyme